MLTAAEKVFCRPNVKARQRSRFEESIAGDSVFFGDSGNRLEMRSGGLRVHRFYSAIKSSPAVIRPIGEVETSLGFFVGCCLNKHFRRFS
jgi:hypothetical protein